MIWRVLPTTLSLLALLASFQSPKLYPGAPNYTVPTGNCTTATNVVLADGTCAPAIPSGMVTLVTSGSCPTGFTEVSALNGKMLRGTVAANGDVGGTGGADTITPAGTNSAAVFTGTAWSAPAVSWPAGVPTFSGSALGTHTHTTTATGTISALTTGADSSTTGGVAKAIAQTPTFTGNSVTSSAVSAGTPAGTVAWPAGVPTIASYTPAGTNAAATFTGTSFDNRPAYMKVIFCQAN